jgi:glycosyltransferase involved in cell wall biosynthesis
MQVLFLIRALTTGGAQRQLVALANGLAQRGHRVTVLTFYPGGELAVGLDPRVERRSLDKRDRWESGAFYARLLSAIRQERPEVMYSFLTSANVLSGTTRLFFPRVRVVWGKRGAVREASMLDSLERALVRLERWLSPFAAAVIYNSGSLRDQSVSTGYPTRNTHVIPNGIDTATFYPDPGKREALRAQWGVEAGDTLVGLVGRLDRIKGQAVFLQAAQMMRRENPSLHLIIIGDGDPAYRDELQALAADLGISEAVTWAGFRSDMKDVYNALDILVSASQGESLPNVLCEAMACGVPCVSTDVGDSARIIGDCGAVVPPGDPAALAQAVLSLLDNLPEIDRKAVRARIVENFSLEKAIAATEKVLERLL